MNYSDKMITETKQLHWFNSCIFLYRFQCTSCGSTFSCNPRYIFIHLCFWKYCS